MGLRIYQNIEALNAHRQLSVNQGNLSKSIERLSSGLRINRAGDDAAGLAISEKMRGQVRGLKQAARNAQDSISLIQSAEGALQETHSILQRMRELAVQSSNDTLTTADRDQIQKEINQLSEELSRIGNTTEFNTQTLLNGAFEGVFHIGANEGQNLSLSINDMRGFKLGVAGNASLSVSLDVSSTDVTDGTYSVSFNGTQYEMKAADGTVVATSTDAKGLAWEDTNATPNAFTFAAAVTSGTVTVASGTATGLASIKNAGLEAGEYTYDATAGGLVDANGKVVATSADGVTFTANGTDVLTFGVAITDKTEISVGGIDVASQTAADSAITTIQSALDKVSDERSKLGALQNRLEHTIANLGTSAENLQAAESRIRDVDMAAEMMDFTKNQILQQAGVAMLAQANQAPQAVLQLLR